MPRSTSPPLAPAPSAWHRLPPWGRDLICLGVLVIAAATFFAPATFGDREIVASDSIQAASAAQSVRAYEAETGENVLWVPNMFSGMPAYLIDYQPAVPQPDTLLRTLRGLAWPFFHFVALLAGTYWLVFYLTRERIAALLAAFAFGFTTYIPIIVSAGHNTKFITLAYLPYLVLAFAFVLRTDAATPRRSWLTGWQRGMAGALLFAIALAVSIRASHVQITYYAAWMLGLWWVVQGIWLVKRGEARTFLVATGWLALGSVLALLMVANPFLPIFEYKAFTIRGGGGPDGGGGGLGWTYGMTWSQGLGELATLLIPNAYGGGTAYWGPKPFTAGPHYVGPIVLALAGLALWRVRKPAVVGLGVAAFVMTLFSLGRHFPLLNRPMFEAFPLFDAFRAPETWLVMVAAALAILAGYGVAYVLRAEGKAATRSVLVAFGAVAAVVLVLVVGRGAFFDMEKEGELAQVAQAVAQQNNVAPSDPRVEQAARQYIREQRAQRDELFAADGWRSLLFVMLGLVAVALVRRRTLPAGVGAAALALLVLVDLYGVDRRFFSEEQTRRVRNVQAAVPEYGFDRYVKQRVAEAGGSGRFRTLSLEGDPSSLARPAFHYETLSGYHGAKLQNYQTFLDRLLLDRSTGRPNDRALDLMSTRLVVTPQPVPGYQTVYTDEQTGYLVQENPDALPRAFLVGQAEVVANSEAALDRIQQPSFDPRQRVVLLASPTIDPSPLDSGAVAQVQLETYTPDSIVWTVDTDAPRLLVASEVYYPAGWNAYVDDQPVPIYQANYLLRALPIPTGQHRVEMRFEPARHRIGLAVSWGSTLLVYLALAGVLGLAWRRREPDEAPGV